MKKILFILSFIFCFVITKAQYPINQNGGGDSALVTASGGFKLRPIMFGYADTTAANLQQIRKYPFAQICTNDNRFWLRSFSATRWIQINTGGGSGGVDSVTSTKTNCTDQLSYWIGSTKVPFDTLQLFDGIIKQGNIVETSPLHFDVSIFTYRIRCVSGHTPLDTTLIIPAYDTLPRYFTIAGNLNNQAVLFQGAESLNPTPPVLSGNVIALGYILQTDTGSVIIPVPPNLDGKYVKLFIADTIYAPKTLVNDTTWFKVLQSIISATTIPSPGIYFQALAKDTNNIIDIPANFGFNVGASNGTAIPNFSGIFKSWYGNPAVNSKNVIIMNGANGDVSLFNGLIFSSPRVIGAGNTINIRPIGVSPTTGGLNIENVIGAYSAGTSFVNIKPGNLYHGAGSKAISVETSENDSSFLVRNDGNVGIGSGSYNLHANLYLKSNGKLAVLDTMNTPKMNGINQNVTSATVNIPGTGLVTPPGVTFAASPVGGIRAVGHTTISGGAVTSVIMDNIGTGYLTPPVATVDTVGHTSGTGNTLPVITAVVSTTVIPVGGLLYNTDSLCYVCWSGSIWRNMCGGSGGGGGSQNLSSVLSFGRTATNYMQIDSLRLFDAPNGGYGGISLSDDKYFFRNYQGNEISSVDFAGGVLSVKNSSVGQGSWSLSGQSLTANSDLLIPNTTTPRTLGVSVNGNFADAAGNITVSTSGSPAGSNTQVQFNNSGSFGASANLTWASPALTIGAAGSTLGQLKLTGNTSGTATIQSQAAAGTPTLTLPNTSGTFAVGASSPLSLNTTTGNLTLGVVPIANGGTNNGSLSVTNQNIMISDGSKIIGFAKGNIGQHIIVNASGNLQFVDSSAGSSPTLDTVSWNKDQIHIRNVRAGYDSSYIVGQPNGVFFGNSDSLQITDAANFGYDQINQIFKVGFTHLGFLNINESDRTYDFGDLSGTHNGVRLHIDESGGGNHFAVLGEDRGLGNNTNLKVDDEIGLVTINATNGFIVNGVKTYTALMNQSGTSDPIATVLGVSTIGTITWSYNAPGDYTGTCTGCFPTNKTWFSYETQDDTAPADVKISQINNDTIRIFLNNATDGSLVNLSMEVRTYP